MEFKKLFVDNKLNFFEIGLEKNSNTYYLAFMVSNHLIDYYEYYAISNAEYDNFIQNELSIIPILERCRKRKEDERMIFYPPAKNRGFPGLCCTNLSVKAFSSI
ncbi:hypothetical protein [Acinetobacter soli]|uniref:hypothetical protein n=1 Tax=Acinetobacter soli TaxID=487316 RepID=UPI00125FE78F|nr:hypothetical protein [Acinetobacter soli]